VLCSAERVEKMIFSMQFIIRCSFLRLNLTFSFLPDQFFPKDFPIIYACTI